MEEVREESEARVYTRRSVFFGQAAYLQCDLDEGAGDEARKDDAAERVVEEGF